VPKGIRPFNAILHSRTHADSHGTYMYPGWLVGNTKIQRILLA
jgi:hypothetical protein